MVIFFVSTLLFMIVWSFLVNYYGKKKCWIAYSVLGGFLFLLFLITNRESFVILFISCSLCAIPASGAYLNDALISDVIDYDEFLTEKRNEGVYTVFSTFVPKIVSIFAQSIPMIVLASKF